VYVLGPKYDPALTSIRLNDADETDESRICDESINIHSKLNHFHIMKAEIGRVYLLLGRELEGNKQKKYFLLAGKKRLPISFRMITVNVYFIFIL